MPVEDLTAEQLKQVLRYDPDTGIFIWLISTSNRAPVGSVAGWMCNGYRYIKLFGQTYLAHRLAWLYVHGEWPKDQVDHHDLDRHNNRITNLRLASQSDNSCNQRLRSTNSSGFKGVSWDSAKKQWFAKITKDNRQIFLGRYPTKELAHESYLRAAQDYHGEFARAA